LLHGSGGCHIDPAAILASASAGLPAIPVDDDLLHRVKGNRLPGFQEIRYKDCKQKEDKATSHRCAEQLGGNLRDPTR
jgi:hypothetical protein